MNDVRFLGLSTGARMQLDKDFKIELLQREQTTRQLHLVDEGRLQPEAVGACKSFPATLLIQDTPQFHLPLIPNAP